ncbi:MAG: glutamine-hydrolyzing carbamoyl-phosphate synthase small subunit [Chloroflexi bacterium]|nr:glutamine-hydrolyzing carbamoyl-phosphate synthase small subunit [Chloroflexota bacterium]
MAKKKGMLVLEDGSTYVGDSLGAEGEWVGEVVFNTSMTGYQEIITDPSYWGQMVVFTCPHIGNVGVNDEDVESRQPFVRAVIARQICEQPSNWRAQRSLPEYLREAGVPALSGVDTRRITLTIREKGVMRGALSTEDLDAERLLEAARNAPDMSVLAAVDAVTCDEPFGWHETVNRAWISKLSYDMSAPHQGSPHIVVIDCGTKHNILRHLVGLGARVTVVPAHAKAEDILALRPDGVLISNGPGDPSQAPATIATARALMGRVPIFGICLGHQILGLAAGARIYKLPFGHHGGNHPVMDLTTGEVEITAQNHNYAVAAESFEGLPFEMTHLNLFDHTVEGMRHKTLPITSVQFHPEASPGPHDSLHLLRRFVASLNCASEEKTHAETN